MKKSKELEYLMATSKLVRASDLPDIEFITTGIADLDDVVQFPRGRITEIFGLQSVGKTTLTMISIAGMTKAGFKTLFIDVENTFNKDWAKDQGVDLTKLTVSEETIVEEIAELIRENMSKFDVIVVDSVAQMIPRAEFEGKSGDAVMGLKARLLGQLVRMITADLAKSKCSLIFINQLRENLAMFTAKYSTPGGLALKFAASLRLELKTTSKDHITKDGAKVGHWVTATVVKTKVGKPGKTARFKVMY
jgi:recombination protein RecA